MNNYCMAACSYLNQSRRLAASFGKRLLITTPQINNTTASLLSPSPPLTRRAVHTSVYDKNPEDHAVPTVVPDEIIQPQSDKPWAPHPQTGVFGPATEQNPLASGERGVHNSAVNTTPAEDSVLELKAFFRPLEDLEKPPPQP